MEWTRMRWEEYISKYTSFYVLFLNYLNILIHFSVAKLRLTLSDPMDCSTPGFLILHYLPEFAQTHVH